jgi:hypothetical protein
MFKNLLLSVVAISIMSILISGCGTHSIFGVKNSKNTIIYDQENDQLIVITREKLNKPGLNFDFADPYGIRDDNADLSDEKLVTRRRVIHLAQNDISEETSDNSQTTEEDTSSNPASEQTPIKENPDTEITDNTQEEDDDTLENETQADQTIIVYELDFKHLGILVTRLENLVDKLESVLATHRRELEEIAASMPAETQEQNLNTITIEDDFHLTTINAEGAQSELSTAISQIGMTITSVPLTTPYPAENEIVSLDEMIIEGASTIEMEIEREDGSDNMTISFGVGDNVEIVTPGLRQLRMENAKLQKENDKLHAWKKLIWILGIISLILNIVLIIVFFLLPDNIRSKIKILMQRVERAFQSLFDRIKFALAVAWIWVVKKLRKLKFWKRKQNNSTDTPPPQ